MGIFAKWQPLYEAHGIRALPLTIQRTKDLNVKKPLTRNPQRMGFPASRQLAARHPDISQIGFWAGRVNRVTVLDIDEPDARLLHARMERHGRSPFIVETASGKFHVYYRHNGEPRIQRHDGEPVDLLGGGLVVLPPTIVGDTAYRIIKGSLDDLDRLPTMCGLEGQPAAVQSPTARVQTGQRNCDLFRYCMKQAHGCASRDELLGRALDYNAAVMEPPLSGDEVVNRVNSAWGYTERGENRVGRTGAWLPSNIAVSLSADPDLCALIVYTMGQNRPDATFWVADGLHEKLTLSRTRFSAARRRAVEQGWFEMVRSRAPGRPAMYRWGKTYENR